MATPKQAIKKYYLVVVADESRADLYRRERLRGPMELARTFENEAARQKLDDLLADRGGRAFDSHGHGRHTMSTERSGPKQHLAEGFARAIAEHIAAEQHKGTLRGYALVAAPRFLGTLRGQLASRVQEEPYRTVDKNVVGQTEADIARLLDQF
ncbi:MAG: host attachment protein [Woeseiaceae bacterium]|nr:host attachment protein [Woeseiaceae bacterium]